MKGILGKSMFNWVGLKIFLGFQYGKKLREKGFFFGNILENVVI
jgi:hypothetical protein